MVISLEASCEFKVWSAGLDIHLRDSAISGPQTFITKQAPAYTGGITAMLASYCIAIFVGSIFILIFLVSN